MASSSVARVARFRERQRANRIMLTIEVDEAELVAVLIEARQLDPNQADDHEAIAEAVEKLLVVFSRDKR
jgi:hypothetical protein